MVHFFSSAPENAANNVMPQISRIVVFVVQNLMFYSILTCLQVSFGQFWAFMQHFHFVQSVHYRNELPPIDHWLPFAPVFMSSIISNLVYWPFTPFKLCPKKCFHFCHVNVSTPVTPTSENARVLKNCTHTSSYHTNQLQSFPNHFDQFWALSATLSFLFIPFITGMNYLQSTSDFRLHQFSCPPIIPGSLQVVSNPFSPLKGCLNSCPKCFIMSIFYYSTTPIYQCAAWVV